MWKCSHTCSLLQWQVTCDFRKNVSYVRDTQNMFVCRFFITTDVECELPATILDTPDRDNYSGLFLSFICWTTLLEMKDKVDPGSKRAWLSSADQLMTQEEPC